MGCLPQSSCRAIGLLSGHLVWSEAASASTKGFDLQELLLTFFREVGLLLIPQGRVVIAVPSTLSIEEEAARILNATFRKFFQYVHRSLTRKILVFFLR